MPDENTIDSTSSTDLPDQKAESQDPGSSTSTTDQKTTILTSDDDADPADTTAEDTKPAEMDEEKAAREAHEALFGAPEGDYELTLPEGVTEVDKDALAAITPIAKKLGLSNAGMSELTGVYATEILPSVAAKVVKGLEADIAARTAAESLETLTLVQGGKAEDGTVIAPDPIFQGKSLKEVKSTAAKALDRFGGTGFREYLEETGLGNRAEMLRFAFLAASAIGEDTSFERSDTKAEAPKSREEMYYGASAGQK